MLAGRVDVVGQDDLTGVAGDQRDLRGSERRAKARHHVLEAGLVRHQRVGVALDEHGLIVAPHLVARPFDQVQRPALVEQRGRRGVEVFRRILVVSVAGQHPSPDPNRGSGGVADREDDAASELVVSAAAVGSAARQANLGQLGAGERATKLGTSPSSNTGIGAVE